MILVLQDKLLDQTSVSHLFPITKYLGLLATGMTGKFMPIAFVTLSSLCICARKNIEIPFVVEHLFVRKLVFKYLAFVHLVHS